MGKTYNVQFNVGKAKYVVNHHDGDKKHQDGSRFFDIATFTNKRKYERFVKALRRDGYAEDAWDMRPSS